MPVMNTIAEIRHANLLALIDELGTQDAIAAAVETSPVYISQIVNRYPDSKTGKPRQIGDQLARKLERCCNKPTGWMDNVHRYAPTISQVMAVMESMPAWQQQQTLQVIQALAINTSSPPLQLPPPK